MNIRKTKLTALGIAIGSMLLTGIAADPLRIDQPETAYQQDQDRPAGLIAQTENRRSMGQGRGASKGTRMGRNMPAYSDYDLNGDGKIIEQEFNEARAKRITERVKQNYLMKNLKNAAPFADIDTNGNGEVSAEEFAAHQLQHRQNRTQ